MSVSTRGWVPCSTSATHVDAEGLLQRRVLEEVVEHLHRLRVALELDDGPHAGAVRLVAQVADAVELVVFDAASAMRSSRVALLTW